MLFYIASISQLSSCLRVPIYSVATKRGMHSRQTRQNAGLYADLFRPKAYVRVLVRQIRVERTDGGKRH